MRSGGPTLRCFPNACLLRYPKAQAAPSVPVVYVALGTLAVLPPALVRLLHEGMAASRRFRFLWVFPAAQTGLLPPDSGGRTVAETRAWQAAYNDSTAAAAAGAMASSDGEAMACSGSGHGGPSPPAAGSILLSDWLPQVMMMRAAKAAPLPWGVVPEGQP